mgnify:CR=1 FL=1
MRESKFTLNSLIVVVMIFSAIAFFFTVLVSSMADWSAVNDYFPIEGTDLAIVYSDIKDNGLYEGPEQACELRVEGSFGHDWGIALEGSSLYANEFTDTALGLLHCDVVMIGLDSFEKETLFEEAILRGRCSTGELVIVTGYLMPSTFPETNSMSRLEAMTNPNLNLDSNGSEVLFLDPESGETVARVTLEGGIDETFDDTFVNRPLAEVLEEVGA